MNEINSLIKLESNQRLGRLHLTYESVPITIVDYSFENEEYQLFIVGENNIVCFETIPKKHSHKNSFFKRISNSVFKKKRQTAYLYLASYMFNSDGEIDESEKELFELFFKNIKIKLIY